MMCFVCNEKKLSQVFAKVRAICTLLGQWQILSPLGVSFSSRGWLWGWGEGKTRSPWGEGGASVNVDPVLGSRW